MDAATLIPHAGEAILIDRIVEAANDPNSREAISTITSEHPYLRDDKVPAVICLELLAQTAAAERQLERRALEETEEPLVGWLAAVPSLQLLVAHFLVGDVLHTRVRRSAAVGNLLRFEGEVICQREGEQQLCAHGTVSFAVSPQDTSAP